MLHLTNAEVKRLADRAAREINASIPGCSARAYAVPRGGVPAAYAIMNSMQRLGFNLFLTEVPGDADLFIDDLIDSGATMTKLCDEYPGIPFYTLIDKSDPTSQYHKEWIVFPWEAGLKEETGLEDNIRRLLEFIGEDPNREGLLETPKRVAKAYAEWFDGYGTDIGGLFKTFTDGAEGCNEMIIIDNIPVESFCEHHMARFNGVAHVGYIPNGKIVGLSKIPKLVRAFAHRLQVQERLTNQIADALITHLSPLGVAVVVTCEHTCMSTRGARVHGTSTTTSAMRGVLLDNSSARAEFLSLIPRKGERN